MLHTLRSAEQVVSLVRETAGSELVISVEYVLKHPNDFSLLLEGDERVVAVAHARRMHWYQVEFFWIAVDPERRRRGFGRQLVEGVCRAHAERGARLATCAMPADCGGAQLFLLKSGFKRAIEFADGRGQPWRVYHRPLTPELPVSQAAS
jgi:GNAT superfamily N-acetyltransferase